MGIDLQWVWQGGTGEYDAAEAVAVHPSTGSAIVAGHTSGGWTTSSSAGERDFAAVKLDADGEVLWSWQAGTSEDDLIYAAAIADDGSVLVGESKGLWGASPLGEGDFAAVRLDEDGQVVWKWQDGTVDDDFLLAVAVDDDDGSMVLAGSTDGDWATTNAGRSDLAAMKLDADGELLWTWQDGGSGIDLFNAAAIGDDSSVFLGGYLGDSDAVDTSIVIKLDGDGKELWRWTSSYTYVNAINGLAIGEDDTIIGAGWYFSDGNSHHYAFKLDADGGLLWEYEGSNSGYSRFEAVSVLDDGTIMLTGTSTRDCDDDSDCTIEVVWLDEDGGEEGNDRTGSGSFDDVHAAAVGPDDGIVIAGWTMGNFMSGSAGDGNAFAGKVYLSR